MIKPLLLLLTLAAGCTPLPTCSKAKTVAKLGGCDKYGGCGVMFTDGTVGNVNHPVEGATYNVQTRCPQP